MTGSIRPGTLEAPRPPLPAAPPTRLHLDHVEGLRALAALVVFVNHAYAQAAHPKGAFSLFGYSMVGGHLAVSVFIVVSGFCLGLPIARSGGALVGGALSFFKRRARRILPPYYAAVVLCLVLIATVIGNPTGTLWDVPILADWKAVVAHALLLQDLFRTGSINYVFWSIAVEWHIYFLFPLLVWAFRRFGPAPSAVAALVLSFGLRLFIDGTRVVRSNPHYIGLFALGMLAAHAVSSSRPEFESWRRSRLVPAACVATFATVVALNLHYGYEGAEPYFYVMDVPTGIFAASLLLHTTLTRESLATRFLSWKPFVFLGTFSYSIYLVHAPLLQLLWQYALAPYHHAPATMFVLLMTGGCVVVLAFAYGFFRLCEEPFMTSKAREARGAHPGAAPVI
jgi:peptidoglycan/LPS O-acetylase OafA/YrhL